MSQFTYPIRSLFGGRKTFMYWDKVNDEVRIASDITDLNLKDGDVTAKVWGYGTQTFNANNVIIIGVSEGSQGSLLVSGK